MKSAMRWSVQEYPKYNEIDGMDIREALASHTYGGVYG